MQRDNTSSLQNETKTDFIVAIEVFNNYYKRQEVVGDKARVIIEPVPFIAFKETLNNAIIHRDYMAEGGIQVAMYDNRNEIRSPGGLPLGISQEVYLTGLTSKPQNLFLINDKLFYS